MNRKILTTVFTLLTLSCSATTFAHGRYEREHDRAVVTAVTPVFDTLRTSTPVQRCWTESVGVETRIANPHDTLVGALVGGVIGSQVSRGSGNRTAGALIGSAIGMSVASDLRPAARGVSYRDVEHCETHESVRRERVLRGYDVDYVYRGRHYSTFMRERPGRFIDLDRQHRFH